MHIQSFPPALGTTTGLASHHRWWTSHMKPASSSFLSSSRMKFCSSTDCLQGFCYTRLASGYIFKWCKITFQRISGICDDCQTNTSTLSWRKVMSTSSYLSPRFPTTRVVWVASAPIWMTFTGTSSPSEGCTQGAEDEMRWCKLNGAWSGAPWPTATSWVAASTWSFSSAKTLAERSPWILMMSLDDSIFRTRYL
jgi:hypothetical protein